MAGFQTKIAQLTLDFAKDAGYSPPIICCFGITTTCSPLFSVSCVKAIFQEPEQACDWSIGDWQMLSPSPRNLGESQPYRPRMTILKCETLSRHCCNHCHSAQQHGDSCSIVGCESLYVRRLGSGGDRPRPGTPGGGFRSAAHHEISTPWQQIVAIRHWSQV